MGAVCLSREIAAGAAADFTFILAWHFPNRTPAWCGWESGSGREHEIIGNWYTTQFKDAWGVGVHLGRGLPELEQETRKFATVMKESTLPAAVKEGATANLTTLVSQTCFRTADGEFHGFEGTGDHGMLPRQLHARVELRDGDAVPVSAVRAVAAQGGVRVFDGRERLHLLPPALARRLGAERVRGGRRADGADHQDVPGLAAERRRGVAAGGVAEGAQGDGVLLGAGRLGRQSRRRDGRGAAQHVRHRVLRAEPAVRHLLPGRFAG